VDATWGHATRITDNPSAAQNDAPRLKPSEVGSQNTRASMRLLPSQWTVENRGDWDKRGLLTFLSHQCDRCREWLPSPEVLSRHQGSCVKKRYQCPVPQCNATFTRRTEINEHRSRASCPRKPNGKTDHRSPSCYVCRYAFSSRQAYTKHLRTPECKGRTTRLLRVFKAETYLAPMVDTAGADISSRASLSRGENSGTTGS
jgi:hypothetical protein